MSVNTQTKSWNKRAYRKDGEKLKIAVKNNANVFSFSAIFLKVDVFTISIIGRSHSNDLNSVNVNEIESYRVDKGKRAVFVENSRKNAVICFDEWVYFIWNSLYIASNAEKASIVSTEHTFIHIPNSEHNTEKSLEKNQMLHISK